MTLADAAQKLEIDLPEGMVTVNPCEENLCSLSLIDSLQERFDLFGNYLAKAKEALKEIQKDEAMHVWLAAACRYYQNADHDHARDLPIPAPNGSLARDFLPLMVMLPTIESTYDNYRKRGFSHEETVSFLNCYKLNLSIVESRILGRPALTSGYFRWLAHYSKCTIFDHGGLNFEMKKSPKAVFLLKNKTSGAYVMLISRSGIHRDGMPLGSAGYEDENGSFEARFEETDDAFIGHPTKNFRIQKEKEVFWKKEWELVCRPEDDVINVHIPRGTDLSPDKVRAAYKDALRIVARSYPEYTPKIFLCSSWLMDPALTDILGKESRISQFSAPFIRTPNKSEGKEIFSFVFCPKDAKDLSVLPERTKLERGLKEKYLKGEYIYAFSGMLPFEKI